MNKLKKILFALAVAVSLGLVGASDAMAQASCTANSVPTLVRSQGLTELTGSLVLQPCTGSIPAGGASITVTISPGAANITNATAFPPTISVNGGAAVAGTISGNTASFPVPATAVLTKIVIGIDPAVGGTVGIRVNVNASGIVFPADIRALLTSSPAGALSITNNNLSVATPLPALTASFAAGAGIAQCLAARITGTPPANGTFTAGSTPTFFVSGGTIAANSIPQITATEGFASALQNIAGEGTDTSGIGTRVILRISGLPSNIRIYAPEVVTTHTTGAATLSLTLVPTADVNGAGGAALGAGAVAGTTDLLASGTTSVTYEVFTDTDSVVEAVRIPLGLFTTGTPSAGTATISIAVAPISTVGTSVSLATAPVPRFADVALSGSTVAVVACVTNVLFPYVTNTLGYDVGLAIANTTSDVFGTTSQTGTCTYNFFGTNAPAGGTFTTPAFAGGVTNTQLLSVIAPGFTGYIISQCNFQLGHGFFFIVYQLGTSAGVAQGSPALIIPQPLPAAVTRSGLASAGPPFAEALGH